MSEPLQINVREVLRAKAPKVHVPEFVIRFLERIVHQDEMNAFLVRLNGVRGAAFARATYEELFGVQVSIDGKENIPQGDAPLIFASNHPLGAIDGVIEATLVSEVRKRPLKLIVNDFLMYMEPLREFFVPVNKVGKQSRENFRLQQQMWESGCDVLTFPAGMCSRRQRNIWTKSPRYVIRDLEWQKSFIQKARTYQRDIVPVYFDGQNTRRFYLIAYWRKLLGIKLNIEMLFLVDEMFRTNGKHFKVRVGKPIPWTTFDDSRSTMEWAKYMQDQVYALADTDLQQNN